jgi:hypothetical protein
VFLYPVGAAGRVVHFSASRAQNVDALFFMLRWAQCGLNKKRTQTHYTELEFSIMWDLCVTRCILVHPWCEMSTHHFSSSSRPGAVSIKSTSGHVSPNLCFASDRILGSRSAFRCIRGTKCSHTIFHAQVGSVRFT